MIRKFLLLLSFSFATIAFGADTYKPDPAHTRVGFTATHLVITKVHGKFDEFDATVLFDEKDITKSSLNGTIKTASVDTGNKNRDSDLRSDSFFYAEKYPEITFQSKNIEKTSDGYRMFGTLTIRGTAKDVSFPFSISGPIQDPYGNTKIGVEARMKLNRKDFNIMWNQLLETGGAVVSDEIEIEIDSELIRQK